MFRYLEVLSWCPFVLYILHIRTCNLHHLKSGRPSKFYVKVYMYSWGYIYHLEPYCGPFLSRLVNQSHPRSLSEHSSLSANVVRDINKYLYVIVGAGSIPLMSTPSAEDLRQYQITKIAPHFYHLIDIFTHCESAPLI